MLIGPVGCGKSTLCQALNDLCIRYRKTQSIEFVQNMIDTPGEYLENRNLNRALAATSVSADIILLIQSCADPSIVYFPSFSSMFCNRAVVGVVSKIDLAVGDLQLQRTREKLQKAGVSRVFQISCFQPDSLADLRNHLFSLT